MARRTLKDTALAFLAVSSLSLAAWAVADRAEKKPASPAFFKFTPVGPCDGDFKWHDFRPRRVLFAGLAQSDEA